MRHATTIISAVSCCLYVNAGYAMATALQMESNNLFVIVQSVSCFAVAVVGSVYSIMSAKRPTVDHQFLNDMANVEALSSSCNDCKRSRDAIAVLTDEITSKLFKK